MAEVALGSIRTKGEIQTRPSQKVSPPRKCSYWKIAFGGLTGLMILEFIPGYVDTFLRTGGNFNHQLTWLDDGYLGVVALALSLSFGYNLRVVPRRYRIWDRSFMCRRCGQILEQPQPDGGESQAMVRELQP